MVLFISRFLRIEFMGIKGIIMVVIGLGGNLGKMFIKLYKILVMGNMFKRFIVNYGEYN